MSKIIALEGPDRVGKATQCRMLRDSLRSMGHRVEVVEVPIDDGLTYRTIYWMLGNGLAKKFPKIFQRLQVLNRWIFQTTKLSSLESKNDFLIFDRWHASTVVYGQAAGLDREFVCDIGRKLRVPEFTFVLTGDAHPHDAEDVYESDKDLQARVRKLYVDWCEDHPFVCAALRCNRPREEIHTEVMLILEAAGIVQSK